MIDHMAHSYEPHDHIDHMSHFYEICDHIPRPINFKNHAKHLLMNCYDNNLKLLPAEAMRACSSQHKCKLRQEIPWQKYGVIVLIPWHSNIPISAYCPNTYTLSTRLPRLFRPLRHSPRSAQKAQGFPG